MPTLKLIGSLTSPYVRKIRILLADKQLDYEFILDDVWSAQPNVLQFNPLGQVPAIILPSGEVLTDSRSIVEYIEYAYPSTDKLSHSQKLQIIKYQALAEGIIDTSVKYRVEQIRPEALQWPDWLSRQQGKLDRVFEVLNNHLATEHWLANQQYSIADITLQCALNFIDFRLTHWNWRADYAHLARFETQFADRKVFAETFPR